MSSQKKIVLDPSTQRLFVHPDGQLPKFSPTPRAVMVIPIYDYNGPLDIPVYSNTSSRASRSGRSSRWGRNTRRYSSYSPSRWSDSSSQFYYSPDEDDSYSRYSGHPPPRPPISHAQSSTSKVPQKRPAEQKGALAQLFGKKPQTPKPQNLKPQNYKPLSNGKPMSQGQQNRPPQGVLTKPPSSAPPAGGSFFNKLQRPIQHLQRFDTAVHNYLKIMPLHPDCAWSACTGRKRALCIGINYIGQKNPLKGCANDARFMREFLRDYWKFPASEILVLTDDDRNNPLPTRQEMLNAFKWLIKDAKAHDSLFLHYSGHGGQTPDRTGREEDGMDEVIFPVDHMKTGFITDDELYQVLVQALPAGCRLTALFDSCHSGTVLDLPYIHSAHGRLRSLGHISKRAKDRGTAPKGDVICFAACMDDETAADTFEDGVPVGAMSYSFIKSLEGNTQQTYEELLENLRHILIPEFGQKAQISSSYPLVLETKFHL